MKRTAPKQGSKVKRSRTRSGCYTCRDRHMKCDEKLPVCQNCINSKRKCYRGTRLNFSSYNYYDPKSSGVWGSVVVPPYYRILDQSIAVSKLYKNGYNDYKKYRYLHSTKDLDDADRMLRNDLQTTPSSVPLNFEPLAANPAAPNPAAPNPTEPESIIISEDINQFLDSWLYSGANADPNSSQTSRNKISENVDIKRVLMNPGLHDKQLGGVMQADFNQKLMLQPNTPLAPRPMRTSFAVPTSPEPFASPEDADKFIDVIHRQKYFWLLDLFNELRIWESCIPSYCIRNFQAWEAGDLRSDQDEKFLLNCLLLCDERVSIDHILEVGKVQNKRWREFDRREVVLATYSAFEKILISIVLILMSVLVRVIKPGFTMDPKINVILANQGRLIHKLMGRFKRVPTSILKRLGSTVFTVGSFQAIVIIRFFLKMRFQKLGIQCGSPNQDEQDSRSSAGSELSYSETLEQDTSVFFTLTEMEVTNLCKDFDGFDLVSTKVMSDAGRVRKSFWELVLLDYQRTRENMNFPNSPQSDTEALLKEEANMSIPSHAAVPNSRCLALNIFSACANKIKGGPGITKEASTKIRDILQIIETSAMPLEIKTKWLSYFDWSLSS